MIALFGSGEFRGWAEPVDRLLLDHATNGSSRVLILPTASAPEGDDVFASWGRMGTEHYLGIGAHPEVLPVKTREDAHRADLATSITGAGLIFLSGGNPGYLANVLRETPLWQAILGAMESGSSLCGCSAGAAALGAVAPDVTSDTVSIEGLGVNNWVEGLRIFPRLIVGAHWDQLDNYVPGLKKHIVDTLPDGLTLLGLDEDTAAAAERGPWTVYGKGGASIISKGAPERVFRAGQTFDLSL